MSVPLTADPATRIRRAIQSEEQRLRSSYRWLAYQDLLGLAFFFGSLVTMGIVSYLYLTGVLPWWCTIPAMAVPLSILHELEHDLIHDLYFRKQRMVQNALFFVIWFAKMSLNPWYRRGIHIRHHAHSGHENDIEERLVGLGLPLGLLRLIVTIHPMGALLLFPRIKRDNRDFEPWKLIILSAPAYTVFNIIWESFFGYVRIQSGWTFPYDPAHLLPDWGWPWARDLTVLLALPNVLRQSALVVMSSFSHYYGDIPKRNVFYQNQILNSWVFLPLQIFCFNFGTTHIIHHYCIYQPFYLRQLVSKPALKILESHGARFNDFDSFFRENHWAHPTATE